MTGWYSYKGKLYHGVKEVAAAAGTSDTCVHYHLREHGHLDFLGLRRGNNSPMENAKDFRYGRHHWESREALARSLKVSRSTLHRWEKEGNGRLYKRLEKMGYGDST